MEISPQNFEDATRPDWAELPQPLKNPKRLAGGHLRAAFQGVAALQDY